MARTLLPLCLLLPALAGAAAFVAPLEEYEADFDREAARARDALKAFQARHLAYETAVDLRETAAARKAEAEALRRLDESVYKKVNRYRMNLEAMQINYAAEALNGRNDPDALLVRFTTQQKTVARLEAMWDDLHKEVDRAVFFDHAAFKEESLRRRERTKRRRLLASAGAACLLVLCGLYLRRRIGRRPPTAPARPDPRHRPEGPARLQ